MKVCKSTDQTLSETFSLDKIFFNCKYSRRRKNVHLLIFENVTASVTEFKHIVGNENKFYEKDR